MRDDPDWLADGVSELVGSRLDRLAEVLVGPAGVVADGQDRFWEVGVECFGVGLACGKHCLVSAVIK